MLRHAEGFEWVNTLANLSKVYTTVTATGTTFPAGRTAGKCISQTSNVLSLTKVFPTSLTWTVGFGFMIGGYSGSTGSISIFKLGNPGTILFNLAVIPGNFLRIFRGDHVSGTTLATSTYTVPFSTWIYIEMKVFIDASVGTCVVRVNENEVINISGANTGSTSCSQVWPSTTETGTSTQGTVRFDDLVYMDGVDATATQGAPFNTFIGDVNVYGLIASGAGSNTGFTPLSSTNISNVDDTDPDDDTTYNSATVSGTKDTFTKAALPSAASTILAVSVQNVARKADAGSRSMKNVLRIGSTNYSGSSQTLLDTYAAYNEIWGLSPATSAAFTKTEVDNMEFGYEVA